MANIIDINYDKLLERNIEYSGVLKGYSYLMGRIRYYSKHNSLLLIDAIERAITDTKEQGYLQEYLERKEFITMVEKILTIEEEIELIRREEREEGIREGIKEGVKEGKLEGKLEIVRSSLEKGLPITVIADITGFTVEEIKKIVISK